MGRSTPRRRALRDRALTPGAREELIRRVRRAGPTGSARAVEVARFKTYAHPTDLFAAFPRIFDTEEILEQIHGEAFPRKLTDLFSVTAFYQPAGPLNELLWAICRAIRYGSTLKDFNRERLAFEKAFLTGNQERAEQALQQVEDTMGQSMWLVQLRFATSQLWGGIEATRRYTKFLEAQSPQPIANFLISFIARKVEATGLQEQLKSDLAKTTKTVGDEIFTRFATAKLFEFWDITTANSPPLLFYEAQSSEIDHYEALIAVLQSASADQTIPPEMVEYLERPLLLLFSRTEDRRLVGILQGLGISVDYAHENDILRADIIELYSKGRYDEAFAASAAYLKLIGDDVAIHALQTKTAATSGIVFGDPNSLIETLKEYLLRIFLIGDDFYAAAYNLIVELERYSGQSWASHLRSIVAHELREEQATFPPLWLRDIFVRDVYVTPFSAVSAKRIARTRIEKDARLAKIYPSTSEIYRALSSYNASPAPHLGARYRSYRGLNELNNGHPAAALKSFKEVASLTAGHERLRAMARVALCQVALQDVASAARTLVEAFLENSSAPSLLPINAIVDALDSSPSQPGDICTPLILELHHSYIKQDRIQHVRLAFERFQEHHGISDPEHFDQALPDVADTLKVMYLDRVWREDYMLQTILYNETHEIEDARIKVCTLLAKLDPQNSNRYLAELKTRVKAQEIAKGINLVESSKVSVDVQAIRKALIDKLRDPYKRYKSTFRPKDDPLIYELSQMSEVQNKDPATLAYILSSFFVRNDVKSEADEQFSAIFAEVTNEFLRGDHGLNAYLSTKVRHGKLVNTLRKPVADARIVTAKSASGADYLANAFWTEELGDAEEAIKQNVLSHLQQFTTSFDRILEYTRDSLLQIRVLHDLKNTGENEAALFVYASSNIERRYFQELDRSTNAVDDLIDRFVEALWKKTDANLTVVQNALDEDVRYQIAECFDQLTAALNAIHDKASSIGELLNSIARARTDTTFALNGVIAWFRRSEVYDLADYSAELPSQIAQKLIQRTVSEAAGWPSVATKNTSDRQLPGRTLDPLVEVFGCIFENAIKHSGIAARDLKVEVLIDLNGGRYSAAVKSDISPLVDCLRVEEKLERVRHNLKQSEATKLAQTDTGSGLYKIWRLLQSRSFMTPSFAFFISGGEFIVEFQFSIETENEYSTH